MNTQSHDYSNDAKETVRKHIRASLHYLENGQLMLTKGEAEKAGEFIWGSMAQALQALAASRNKRLANHRSLRWFVAEVSRKTGDKSINEAFWQAETLHSNFHSVELTVEDIATMVGPIREAVFKLHSLVSPEMVNE